jgi:hypothetical protein
MDDDIEFNEAAFRHNISKEDIRWAATHPLYEDLLEGFCNKYPVLGYEMHKEISPLGGVLGDKYGTHDRRRSLGAG